jgi:ribosomal protein S19
MRSLYKIPFVHKSAFKKYIILRQKSNVHKKMLKILEKRKMKLPTYLLFWKRASKINSNYLIGKKVSVYNGKYFISVILKKFAIGYRLGQFTLTRKKPIHSGKYKQRKKLSEKGIDLAKKSGVKFNLTLKKFIAKKKIKKWV